MSGFRICIFSSVNYSARRARGVVIFLVGPKTSPRFSRAGEARGPYPICLGGNTVFCRKQPACDGLRQFLQREEFVRAGLGGQARNRFLLGKTRMERQSWRDARKARQTAPPTLQEV
jgi:hypothetical protein